MIGIAGPDLALGGIGGEWAAMDPALAAVAASDARAPVGPNFFNFLVGTVEVGDPTLAAIVFYFFSFDVVAAGDLTCRYSTFSAAAIVAYCCSDNGNCPW